MQNLFKNAINAYNAGNYTSALDYFNQAISLDSNSAFAYNGRGNIYNALQDLSLAINDYTRAISLKPNFPDAYCNRGIVQAKLKNYSSALNDYTQAITIDPNYINAYSYRGLIYKEIGDLMSAIRDYSHAISLNPNLLEAYHNRSHAYFMLGDSKNALSDAEKEADLGNSGWLELLKEMIDTDTRIKSTDHNINQIADVVMEKNILGLLIEQDGIDKVSKELAKSIIADTIPSQKIARQFILEELDAASGGNEETERFILKSGIPKSEYEGAMFRSFEEVDGPDGPQAILNKIPFMIDDRDLAMRFRIKVVELIMEHFEIGNQKNYYNENVESENYKFKNKILDCYIEKISTKELYVEEGYKLLSVILTPASLLKSNERFKRLSIEEDDYVPYAAFDIKHDSYNSHDDKALEVYANGIFIGHVRKRFKDENIDKTNMVNSFCFNNNKLKDVKIHYVEGKYWLFTKTEEALRAEARQQEIRQKEIDEWNRQNNINVKNENDKNELSSLYLKIISLDSSVRMDKAFKEGFFKGMSSMFKSEESYLKQICEKNNWLVVKQERNQFNRKGLEKIMLNKVNYYNYFNNNLSFTEKSLYETIEKANRIAFEV